MMRTLLVRGLIAGLVAGAAACAFAFLVGEPQVDAAIAIEEAGAAHGHSDGEEELVSRDLQSTVGLLVANSAYGVAIGGLFAIAFAFVYGRFGSATPRTYASLLAAGGFGAIVLVPFLKYPANPPAVGQPGTITSRTELYFSFLGVSLIAVGLAVYAAKVLAERLGGWTPGLLSFGGYLVVMIAAGLVYPDVNEVPADFPATVLWDFRVASLGTLFVMWVTVWVVFGVLAQRVLAQRAVDRPTAESAPAISTSVARRP